VDLHIWDSQPKSKSWGVHKLHDSGNHSARTGEESPDIANGLPPMLPVVREEKGVWPEKGEPRTPIVLRGLGLQRPDMGLMLVPERGI
jgi:hypothetical protein